MGKNLPTGIISRVHPTTGRKQYRARIQDASTRTESGKPKQVGSKWLESLQEAKDWLEESRHTKRTVGTLDFDRTITVGEACEAWLKVAKSVGIDGRQPIEETTAIEYTGNIDRRIKPTIGAVRVSDLTKPRVMKWRDDMVLASGADATKRTLGVLRQVLAYQSSLGTIPFNPA